MSRHDMFIPLLSQTVVGVDVSEDEHALRFRCADGSTVVWDTEGDCCSESWWADGVQLDSLRGGKVVSIEELEMPSLPYGVEDNRSRQESDQLYGYRVDTNKGSSQFIFRNSSNGYYGGWAMLGKDNEQFDWREISGNDWQA